MVVKMVVRPSVSIFTVEVAFFSSIDMRLSLCVFVFIQYGMCERECVCVVCVVSPYDFRISDFVYQLDMWMLCVYASGENGLRILNSLSSLYYIISEFRIVFSLLYKFCDVAYISN